MGFAIRSTAAFLLAACVLPVVAIAAASDPVPVSTGADFVSPPSVPEQFFLDARTRPAIAAWKPGDPIREIPRQFHGEDEAQRHPPTPANPVIPGTDLLVELQREVGHPAAVDAFTTPLVNIVGQGNTGVFPPDPSGDVGGGYFVQAINGSGGALFKIYNTADGTAAAGPFSMDGLGSGGPCASGLGDGVVVFDQLANRWLFTEFANVGNNLCVYLSATDNPVTTTWTRYVFTTPSFPDYPKYGVWPDAYYVGANEGPAVYALDRAKMLAAQPATLQRKTVPSLGGLGFQMVVPGSVSGSTPPPAGAPGLFGRDNDDERNNPGSNDPTKDFIELFAMHVDWTTPGNTTLTGPIRVDEAEFDSEFNVTSGFGAIHQPNTSQTLDPLLEVLMYPLYYRNFGDHESLIGNHVTQIQTGNIAGVRWFELRRTGGAGGSWSMYQQGTFAPTDAGGQISRWMAAIGMDQTGNIALGYSVARATPAVFPGLSYTGRLATDPLGVMTQPETSLVAGVTSQTQADRWGDYHQMGVDPADGCTFWFTGEYMTSGSQWTTRVSSFKFDACGTEVGFTLSATNLTQTVCAATATPVALQPVSITVSALNGFNLPVTMSFAPPGLPIGFAGSYAPNPVTPPGSTVASLDVTNASTPGAHSVILRGTGDSVDHDLNLAVDVVTQVPTQVALVAPADNATGQPSQPTFSWSASAQTAGYLIEISTSATFATTILAQSLPGGQTTFTPTAALPVATQLYWRVTATNTCGTAAPSPTFTFTTADGPRPTIVVNPTAITATAAAGAVVTKTLTIGNSGTLDLNWTIDESAVADCSAASSIPWMSVSPLSGLVHAGAIPQATTVNLNATGLTPGSYSAAICVHSNDPTHLVTPVPVTFTVTGPPTPTISVSPTSIATSVAAGASATATLSIGNTGNATLTWTADTSATACTSPTAVGWLTIAPTSGSVGAGAPANDVTVTTDSTGLAAGTYTANVCVHANDAAHPLTTIPVSFEVTAVDRIFTDGFEGTAP